MNNYSKNSHTIKNRIIPKDIFYTPEGLVKEIMSIINSDLKEGDKVLDGFYGKGVFFNNYPNYIIKDFTEIEMEKDFFKYKDKVDYCISNPPYSILNNVINHTIDIVNKGFGYLLHIHALTHARLRKLEERGFYLRRIHICKVSEWYGNQIFVFFLKVKGKCEVSYSLKQFKSK